MKNKLSHKKAFSALRMPPKYGEHHVLWCSQTFKIYDNYRDCQNDTLINHIKKYIIIMGWIIIDCKGCFTITTLF